MVLENLGPVGVNPESAQTMMGIFLKSSLRILALNGIYVSLTLLSDLLVK